MKRAASVVKELFYDQTETIEDLSLIGYYGPAGFLSKCAYIIYNGWYPARWLVIGLRADGSQTPELSTFPTKAKAMKRARRYVEAHHRRDAQNERRYQRWMKLEAKKKAAKDKRE